MSEGAVQLRKRLAGRAEMCLNNARHHPDQRVRDANIIRHKAYLAAERDAKEDDEVNALVALWQAVASVNNNHGLQGAHFKGVRAALDELNKVWAREK